MYSPAYKALINRADAMLEAAPLSVMMKKKDSPSGDNHDYTSLARYFHPDPAKPDGIPYVNRDGVTNPEISLYDRENLGTTATRVSTLALAGFLSGDRRYSDKAAELLRVWFLDPATRMNPQLEYAQMVPGINGNKGRCYGVLDGYSIVEMLDGVALMRDTESWPESEDAALREWMSSFLDWLLTSPQGIEESQQANNHSTAYDAQAIAIAMYVGRDDVARGIIEAVPERRIFTQIEPDGMQPHEMWRTLSFGYSQYNLTHLIDIFQMAQKLGRKIDGATDAEGRNFYKALDLLASYLGKPVKSWPGQQISDWEDKQAELARDLLRVYTRLDRSRSDYRQAFERYGNVADTDRFVLLYMGDEPGRRIRSLNDGWTFTGPRGSESVCLPHCWNTDAYSTRDYYRGAGTYSRSFAVAPELEGKRLYLKFDGAATESTVRIDGKEVSRHVGAYSPHLVDITGMVTPGVTHTLEVLVDNSDKDIPPYSADFTFMGGLYRDAWLIAVPQLHLDFSESPACGFKLTSALDDKGRGTLHFEGRLLNFCDKAMQPQLTVEICDAQGQAVARKTKNLNMGAGKAADATLTFNNLAVDLWSPESPTLYKVSAILSVDGKEIDRSDDYTGFRSFAFDDEGRFMLNGKPCKLRGMCRHHDQFPMGIALSDEQHRRDMQLIKDLGANFVRISHYPQDDAVLEMCDRLGLIAWEEIPVIDYVPDSNVFADNCEQMLREMVRSHYNHPSIAMWGYMNEILLRGGEDSPEESNARALELGHRLGAVLSEEDPDRFSTMAYHGSDVYNEWGFPDLTDVQGWNLYQGWYGGTFDGFEQFLSRQHREHPRHRLIVSEYGAGSDLRLHSLEPQCFDFSIEYQQLFLEHYLPVIEDSTFVAGASHWNFIDFSSANRAESMPHINNKGLVTNTRHLKDVYYYYKACWSADTVAHIAARDWARRTELVGPEGFVRRPVKVYTNLPEVILSVNGRALVPGHAHNYSTTFDVDLRPGTNLLILSAPDGQILDVATIEMHAIHTDGQQIDPGVTDLAINVGSNCYFRSDDSGLTWLPDRPYRRGALYGYVGGRIVNTNDEIAVTRDQPLLQRSISGLQEYRIDVVPGSYEVELSFADPASPSALSAYMLGHNAGTGNNEVICCDIYINGQLVEAAFSPAEISGVKTAVTRRYITSATDGIRVSFIPSQGTSSLAAIKLRRL